MIQLRAQLLQLEDSKNKLIAKHQQGVMDLRSYYDNELDEKNAEIQRLENEIHSTNSPRIDNTELMHTREQLKEVDSKLQKRDHEIVVLNSNINSLEHEVAKYKQLVISLEAQLERLKSQEAKPDPKLELERVQQLERMRSMTDEMNNMTLVIKQLSRDKEMLTSDNIRLTNQLEDAHRELRQKQSVPTSNSLSERDMELAVLKYANKYFTPMYQEPRYESPRTYSPVPRYEPARPYSPPRIEPSRSHDYSPRTMEPTPMRTQSPPRPQEPSPKQSRTTNIQSSAPFATDQSLVDSTDITQQIQDQLIELSLEKNDLDGEYQKLMSSNLKTIKSRKRKMEIEQRLESIAKQGSDLRTELKKQLAAIR